MKSVGRIGVKLLVAGALGLGLIGGAATDSLANVTPGQVATTVPSIEKVTYIGSSLGTSEITNDGRGNLVATRYTDAASVLLSPVFKLADVADNSAVTMRITVGDSVSRVKLTENRFGAYERFGMTSLARPGAKGTTVRFDVLVGQTTIGSLTVPFAPKASQPAGYNPQAVDGQLVTVANVRLDGDDLAWDAVPGAQRYQISAYLCDESGRPVELWRAESDNLTGTRESVAEIASFLDLPAGDYRFSIKASTLHEGYWNQTVASQASAKTDVVTIN